MERTIEFSMGGMGQLWGMEQFLVNPNIMVGTARMTTSKGTEKDLRIVLRPCIEVGHPFWMKKLRTI